jgi:spermidine synthase
MIPYAIGIFLSAFLLFLIQPILSKALLPWFGGGASVWSSAMVFFQVVLTGGYAYSNWLVMKKNRKAQTTIHLILVTLSVLLLACFWIFWSSPITPSAAWQPVTITQPFLQIFLLLAVSAGLPLFLLSANSPLMQAWSLRLNPSGAPYWLYSLSNIGSILGLLIYPIVVEPALSRPWQERIWSGGYLIFACLVVINAIRAHRSLSAKITDEKDLPTQVKEKPNGRKTALWVLLSALGSLMLLAVTNTLTQEVAATPFLWVLPLTIYLLTFVLAFSSKQRYHRGFFTTLLLFGTVVWILNTLLPALNFMVEITIYCFLLFSAAMICHGELYALRPSPTQLTRFYLMVSCGGALGGFFVSFLAPLIFQGYWELYLGVACIWILLAILALKSPAAKSKINVYPAVNTITAVLVILHLGLLIFYSVTENQYIRRNFFGVVQVRHVETGDALQEANVLVDGETMHGLQLLDATVRDLPTSYYSAESGIGLAIKNHPRYGSGLRVGILGLGTGTLAAYGQTGDVYRFYEINPAVIDLAKGKGGYFSFLQDSQANIDIIPGDARISLEKEASAGVRNDFDILVLDTFSSDSIPVHLVTSEAFQIYLQNLAPDGLIAVHITNVRLDLRPVFWQLAQKYQMGFAVIENPVISDKPEVFAATWVLLARDPAMLELPALADRATGGIDFRTDIRLWSDDYSNPFQLLK